MRISYGYKIRLTDNNSSVCLKHRRAGFAKYELIPGFTLVQYHIKKKKKLAFRCRPLGSVLPYTVVLILNNSLLNAYNYLYLFTIYWRRKWQPTPVFLFGESQGWGSLVGCRLWGLTESDTTEAT